MPQGVIGPVDHNISTRHPVQVAVKAGATLQLGAEAYQGVMDTDDVAAGA